MLVRVRLAIRGRRVVVLHRVARRAPRAQLARALLHLLGPLLQGRDRHLD
jgi:hypothetical protein